GRTVHPGDGHGGPVLGVFVVDVGDLLGGPGAVDEHADLAVGEVGVAALDLVDAQAGAGGVAAGDQARVEFQALGGLGGIESAVPCAVLLDGELAAGGLHEAADAVDEVGGRGHAGDAVLLLQGLGGLDELVPCPGRLVADLLELVGVVPEGAYAAVPGHGVLGVVEGAVGVGGVQEVVAVLPLLGQVGDVVEGAGVGPGRDLVVADLDHGGAAADQE